MPESKAQEKEREAQLKALREELEAEIEEKLAQENLSLPLSGGYPDPLNGKLRKGLRGPSSNEAEAISNSGLLRPAASGGSPRNDESLSLKRILEALLFASGKPLTLNEIRKIIGASFTTPTEKGAVNRAPTAKEIEHSIAELREEYHREGRSFELIEIAGGVQMVTRREYAAPLARLEQQKKAKQASQSALETLAILAYKQPVTRAEIEELRGVDISGVLSTLLERGFIKIAGKKEVPGRPFLYGTTEKFLEHFGLKALTDLPQIGEIKALVERAVKREELAGEALQPSALSPQPEGAENKTGDRLHFF